MISSLRKRHRKMWKVLAVAIPLLFVVAALQQFEDTNRLEGMSPTGRLSELETFEIRTSESTLTLEIKSSLRSAHSEVYGITGQGCSSRVFLGTVRERGVYSFDLNQELRICEVRILDALNETMVDKIVMR